MIPRLFAWPPARTPARGDRAALDRAARREHDLPVRHRHREHPVLVRLPLRLRQGALLRGGRVRRRARRAPRREAPGRAARVPRRAACSRRCATTSPRRAPSPTATSSRSRPTRRRSAGAACSRPSAAARPRCSSPTPAQSIGGPLRSIAFLAPRREGGFPVNKTADGAQGHARRWSAPPTGSCCAGGPEDVELSLAELRALPQATHTLTLGCVEGWSTRQTWTGVPLAELARRAGVADPRRAARRVAAAARACCARRRSPSGQVADSRSLLALRVGGADLPLDHGYPARIIVPGAAGRAQHQVGRERSSSAHEGALRRIAAAPARAPRGAGARRLGAAAGARSSAAPSGSRCGWSAPSCCTTRCCGRLHALDRLARRGRPAGWANYVRVPVGVSALLAARVLPRDVRARASARTCASAARTWEGYAGRWLLVSAALFVAAGALYLVRSRSGSSS